MNTSLNSILKASNILFIDDKNNVPINIQNCLNIFFSNVFYTNDLDIAHDNYLEKNISVIISEISTTKHIKLLKFFREYNHKIPIIIVSETKKYDLLLEIIRLQVVDLIYKPIKINPFIFALNNTAKYLLREGNVITKFNKKYVYNYINKTVEVNFKTTSLTKNESKLLELLLSKSGQMVTKDEIENYIWGEIIVSTSAFKSLFQRIKSKIGTNTIINKSGHGYYIKID
jgi:DNA-binding response OmpR family regulator